MNRHFSFEEHAWDWEARRTRVTRIYDALGRIVAVTVWLKRPAEHFQIHGHASVSQFLEAARGRHAAMPAAAGYRTFAQAHARAMIGCLRLALAGFRFVSGLRALPRRTA